MKTLIEASHLSFRYPNQSEFTLKDIQFSLKESESMGILGPNGGGKSTLIKLLSRTLIPTSGKLHIDALSSYVPQSSGLNTIFPMTAYEFLFYAGKALGIKNPDQKIQEVSAKIGINDKLSYSFQNMSGGEKQRILLSKALLTDPRILLLDEPTKGLDSLGQDQLLGVLTHIKEEFKTAVVIVDHNINQVIRHCDKILCLNRTSHWHEHKDLLTQSILENIYRCEFEHLLIHDKEKGQHNNHQFCNHPHAPQSSRPLFKRNKS